MEKNIFNITVDGDFHGYRVDKFLQIQITKISRTRLQRLIQEGQVKINNVAINQTSKKIKKEDKIKVEFPALKKTLHLLEKNQK